MINLKKLPNNDNDIKPDIIYHIHIVTPEQDQGLIDTNELLSEDKILSEVRQLKKHCFPTLDGKCTICILGSMQNKSIAICIYCHGQTELDQPFFFP